MPTPAELREASRLTRFTAEEESDQHLKRRPGKPRIGLGSGRRQMERERRGTGDLSRRKRECPLADMPDVDQCCLASCGVIFCPFCAEG